MSEAEHAAVGRWIPVVASVLIGLTLTGLLIAVVAFERRWKMRFSSQDIDWGKLAFLVGFVLSLSVLMSGLVAAAWYLTIRFLWRALPFCLLFGIASVAVGQHRRIVTASDNPFTAKAASLGKILFFDTRFSSDGAVSCASCHLPDKAFTTALRRAQGVRGQLGHRNAPTILNTAHQARLMWDGRFQLLEGQASFPVSDPGEMGLSDQELTRRLNAIPGYVRLFQETYGRNPNTIDFCRAIASFERTLISTGEPFGRYLAGDVEALDYDGVRGALSFVGLHGEAKQHAVLSHGADYAQRYVAHYFNQRTGCAACHNGPDYRDGGFHRTGVALGKIDQGLETITGNQADVKKFKTPTLKNIGETWPYFHDGSFDSLEQVVRFYNLGGNVNDGQRDGRLVPLGMSEAEELLLAKFLRVGMEGVYPKVEPPSEFPR